MNKVCIVGCRDLVIEQGRRCCIGAGSFSKGDFLSFDGHTGAVYSGKLEVVTETPDELLSVVEQWRQFADRGGRPRSVDSMTANRAQQSAGR